MTPDQLRGLADALETTGRPGGICQRAANYLRECADAQPAAYILPSDLAKFTTRETSARAFSVPFSTPKARSVALYLRPAPRPQPEVAQPRRPYGTDSMSEMGIIPMCDKPQPKVQPASEPTEAHPMLCATHYCKDCAALWRQCDDFSFTLRSQACCTACNNAPVGGQLFALTTPVAMPRPSEPTEAQIMAAADALIDESNRGDWDYSEAERVAAAILRAAREAKEPK